MEVDEKIAGNGTIVDLSSIRGKKALVSPSHEQFDLLKKLLEKRIIDSGGETIFEIGTGDNEENGLEPDEYAASVCTIVLIYFFSFKCSTWDWCSFYLPFLWGGAFPISQFRWPHFNH